MNKKFEKLRLLTARYWKPIFSIGAGIPILVNVLKIFGVSIEGFPFVAETLQGRIILIAFGTVFFILLRFPVVAIHITRFILGAPDVPQSIPLLFRGLRSFDESDVDSFPGRKKEIESCWLDIKKNEFFILEGESGSGKTSLLKAALIPRAKETYDVIYCQISKDPFGKLASALTNNPYQELPFYKAKEIIEGVIKSKLEPNQIFEETPSSASKQILLCIDQFEEFFVTVKDIIRKEFMLSLMKLINKIKLTLVITIRSDFRDLLDKLCRDIDPNQEILNVCNSYYLKLFSRDEAKAILDELLFPIHEGQDPLLEQQISAFNNRLILDLLRPPSDRRLNIYDQKTILPVELQTLGMMIETRTSNIFSVSQYRRLGGKIGLFRAFIEEAKIHVMRKTGLPPKKSLMVLRYLISPAQTKWIQTVESLSKALKLSKAQVQSALDGFSEKYLVNRLPRYEGVSQKPSFSYELMHEHLINFLSDVPDPILQKLKRAKDKLRIWYDQTEEVFSFEKGSFIKRIIKVLKSIISPPVPFFESISIWRYADREERLMLKKNTIRQIGRSMIFLIMFLFLISFFYTDSYQINEIIDKAPILQFESEEIDSTQLNLVHEWLYHNVQINREVDAFKYALYINDEQIEYHAILYILDTYKKMDMSELDMIYEKIIGVINVVKGPYQRVYSSTVLIRALIESNRNGTLQKVFEEALKYFAKIKSRSELENAVERIASVLVIYDPEFEFEEMLKRLDNKFYQFLLLVSLSKKYSKDGNIDVSLNTINSAITIIPQMHEESDKYKSLNQIAEFLSEVRPDERFNKTITKVLKLFKKYEIKKDKEKLLTNIAIALIKIGRYEEAFEIHNELNDLQYKEQITVEYVKFLTKLGRSKEALEKAYALSIPHLRDSALESIAKYFIANRSINEVLNITKEIVYQYQRDEILTELLNELIKTENFAEARLVPKQIFNSGYSDFIIETAIDSLLETKSQFEDFELVHEVKDQQIRDRIFSKMCVTLIKVKKIDKALMAANYINIQHLRDEMYRNISIALKNCGKIENAIDILCKIRSVYWKDTLFKELITYLTQINKKKEAYELSKKINDPYLRKEVLDIISPDFVKNGFAKKRLQEASQISNEFIKNLELSYIIQAMALSGESENALEHLSSIDNGFAQDLALEVICKAFLKADKYENAQNTMIKISNKYIQNNSRGEIIRYLIKLGKINESFNISFNSNQIFGSEKDHKLIAESFLNVGNYGKAMFIGQHTESVSLKIQILCEISEFLIRDGNIKEAEKILNAAYLELKVINEYTKIYSYDLATISESFAHLNKFRKARLIAEECGDNVDKLNAFLSIIKAYASNKYPHLEM